MNTIHVRTLLELRFDMLLKVACDSGTMARRTVILFAVVAVLLWRLFLFDIGDSRFKSITPHPSPEQRRQQNHRARFLELTHNETYETANAEERNDERFKMERYEESPARLQASANLDTQSTRVLVLSWHGGTAKDTAMQLHNAGVRRENIVCGGIIWYEKVLDSAPCVRDHALSEALNRLTQRVRGFPMAIDPADEKWLDDFAAEASEMLSTFHVLWADFPTVLCLLLNKIAPHKLIVRTTHRFDHQVAHSKINHTSFVRKSLMRVLREAPILLAGSEYDRAYMKFYTCREPERLFITWPTQYLESLGASRTLTNESCFILWGGSNNEGSSSISITFDRIRVLGRTMESQVPMKSRPTSFAHASEFATEQAVVYFPYSMPSSAFHELYASGVPLFVPSLTFMLDEFSKNRGYPHKVAGNVPCASPSFYENAEAVEFCCLDDTGVCHDPNSCDPEALKQWVSLGDLYTTPHVTYFDSAEHAVELMSNWMKHPDQRDRTIEDMESHNVANLRWNARVVQAAIRHVKQSSPLELD